MATMMIPSKSAQMTLHDKDYFSVKTMMDNARAIMQPGDIRVDTRCPVCGGVAWVLPERHNDGQSIVAMCENKCFWCEE